MVAKRKSAARKSNDDEMDEEYRKKRDRNNQAVKRSRVKSKQRTQETLGRVNELRVKNQILEEKIKQLNKDLKFLKDLFLTQASSKFDKLKNIDLKKLLEDDDSDMDEPGASTSSS